MFHIISFTDFLLKKKKRKHCESCENKFNKIEAQIFYVCRADFSDKEEITKYNSEEHS